MKLHKDLHNLYSSWTVVKKNEIGGTYVTHWQYKKCIYNFGVQRERDYLGDLGMLLDLTGTSHRPLFDYREIR
jgi:hypothetical protein